MTTRLAGWDPFFLPFNRGTSEGGAGNPQAPDDAHYAVSDLWERLVQPDAWRKVLGRFLHLVKKDIEDFDGKTETTETMVFPRFPQWAVVNQRIDATRVEGAGKRSLIQHSAGSGKSNSVAWTARSSWRTSARTSATC